MTTTQPKTVEFLIAEIDEACNKRLKAGEKEYGRLTFFTHDCLIEAEEELLDLINYAKFQIIKLRTLRQKLEIV